MNEARRLRAPDGGSRAAMGCGPDGVREANGVRACIVPAGTPEAWEKIGELLEASAWPLRIPPPPEVPARGPLPTLLPPGPDTGIQRVTRVDTVWQVDHTPEIYIERRLGARYSFDAYRYVFRRRSDYDEWARVIEEINRLLRPSAR